MAERKNIEDKELGRNCYCCKHYHYKKCWLPNDIIVGYCDIKKNPIYDEYEFKDCHEPREPRKPLYKRKIL